MPFFKVICHCMGMMNKPLLIPGYLLFFPSIIMVFFNNDAARRPV